MKRKHRELLNYDHLGMQGYPQVNAKVFVKHVSGSKGWVIPKGFSAELADIVVIIINVIINK